MSDEELTVMDCIISDLQRERLARRDATALVRKTEEKLRRAEDELLVAKADAEHLQGELDAAKRALDEMMADYDNACKELDETRKKLGEWARFINYGVYERLSKFVPRGRTPKDKLACAMTLLNGLEADMFAFKDEHPLTIIEGGKAK